MGTFNRISWLALLAAACAGRQYGQEMSRAAEIEARQHAKAAAIEPDRQPKLERWMLWIKDERVLDRIAAGIGGFRARIGGLVSGSGFAAGPEYLRAGLAGGRIDVRVSAQASMRGYRRYEFHAGTPSEGKRFFAEFYTLHHDYPGMNYYGSGPGSEKAGRTHYRLRDTAVDATFGFRAARHITAGVSAGYLFNDIGPGSDSRFASTDLVYAPAQAAGIDEQANFLRTSAFLQYDWRDNSGGARRGGNCYVQFSDYRDQTLGRHDFRRLDLEVQQYISFLNERRVVAVRARSTLTFRNGSQTIPFYMQPSLGGSEDLRGYRPFRFRGNNLFVVNAEYRWEVFSGLDMALFGDAGQVFARGSDFSLSSLESDIGFGLRFNARNRTFMRIDVGFSHEGFQVWVKFNGLYQKGPVRTSSSMGDF